jgi:hypothetical protein
MATSTYNLIGTPVVVGSGGASTITFSSIPQTYTDLLIKLSGRGTSGSFPNPTIIFNGSSTGYSWRGLYGDGSGTASNNQSSTSSIILGTMDGSSETSNTFGNMDIYIPNYASSNYKSVSTDCVPENNATTNYMYLIAGLWSNTAAITSITINPGSGNFAQYSTAYLYGIKNS